VRSVTSRALHSLAPMCGASPRAHCTAWRPPSACDYRSGCSKKFGKQVPPT
jgi:hypothetical protein